MNTSKTPLRHCCERMKNNLEWGDMLQYVWYIREYSIESTQNSAISCKIDYCPFCGKEIGTLSLLEKYEEACEQPQADKIDWSSAIEVEAFNKEFFAKHEALPSQEGTEQNLEMAEEDS